MTFTSRATAENIDTVLGPITVESLGRTLMHEHLAVGFPGWRYDDLPGGWSRRELVARCCGAIEELKDAGYASMVDPCPTDMGRDVDLMREVASRTGFNIICAAGFYHATLGETGYWQMRCRFDPDCDRRIADLLIKEAEDGIGDTGVKAGIFKLATGTQITPYEELMMKAIGRAAAATGKPVTTHTEAVLGDRQVAALEAENVHPSRVIVGHSCGSNDHDYHRSVLDTGAYIGFDRFGLEDINSDAHRVTSLARVVAAGFGDRVVVSHDCVLCLRGMEDLWRDRAPPQGMMHFERNIVPMLRAEGVEDADIRRLTDENPQAFFRNNAARAAA